MYLELKTSRLLLRPLCVKDLQTTHEYASCEDTTKFIIFLPNRTVDETLQFLQSVEHEWNKLEPRYYEFAVCLDNKHIGAVSLALENNSTGELGWILNRKYHGNGYCFEAATAVLDFTKRIGVRKLRACCDSLNIASRRVMEKLGMSQDCVVPRKYLDGHGQSEELQYVLNL